jgi:peptide deformylase
MNIKEIAEKGQILLTLRMGNPLLKIVSEEVNPDSSESMKIIFDMAATINSLGEIAGLAAIQVAYPKRILFYQVIPSRGDMYNPKGVKPSFLINPTYRPVGEEKTLRWEACISTPGIAVEVERYNSIHVEAIRWNGFEFSAVNKIFYGYEARVLQHEIDHLDGIIHITKRKTPKSVSYVEEAQEFHIKN